MSERDHERILDRLGETHEERLLGVLTDLENNLADMMDAAPVREGALFDLAWATQARADIQRIMRETFLSEADSFIREYDQIGDSLSDMFEEYGGFFGVSDDVVTALKNISFQGFEDIASTFTDELGNELYQNTLAGRPRTESIKNMRQKINGVYIESDKDEINRLVAIAEKGGEAGEEAVRKLHKVYAADRVGNNMRRYASQMVNDSLNQYSASLTVAAAKETTAKKWKYFGGLVTDSRSHCVSMVNRCNAGETFTEEEIREIWASKNWEGKSSGDPFIVRGGYNCRHLWRPVFEVEDA